VAPVEKPYVKLSLQMFIRIIRDNLKLGNLHHQNHV